MEEFHLDKAVGSSVLNQSNFASHYESGVCVFACGGIISVVLPKSHQRNDFIIQDDIREIGPISFSMKGNEAAIGEIGLNSRILIVKFSETFDSIVSKTEIKTKENGFRFISYNADNGRLLACGFEDKPFLLLWDTKAPKPVCIGYHRINCIPNHICMSQDSSIAVVCGNGLLRFVSLSIIPSDTPVSLRSRKGNIEKVKDAMFVSAGINPQPPNQIYALTSTGTICVFEQSYLIFQTNERRSKVQIPISISLVHLSSGETTSLALDDRIILVGTQSGSILAIKKENTRYAIFGQFSIENKSAISIALAKRYVFGAYDDGSIVFWVRKIDAKPTLSIPSHRGAICSLFAVPETNEIVTLGSDGTVRGWEKADNQQDNDRNSYEERKIAKLVAPKKDSLETLSGVRSMAFINDMIAVGDDNGTLFLLNKHDFSVIGKTHCDDSGSICSMFFDSYSKYLATGSNDGGVRLYSITGSSIKMIRQKIIHSSPISSIIVSGSSLVSAGTDGIIFSSLDSIEEYASFDRSVAILSLCLLPNFKYIVGSSIDGHLFIIRVQDGFLFRQYRLSLSSYAIGIGSDPTGIFLIGAMNDGSIRFLDIYSGDIVKVFIPMAGVITSFSITSNSIFIGTLGGCFIKWDMPLSIRSAISERIQDGLPSLSIESPKGETRITGSFMKGKEPLPGWVFKEVSVNPVIDPDMVAQCEEDVSDDNEQGVAYDGPRPVSMPESRIDDIIRTSMTKRPAEKNQEVLGDDFFNDIIDMMKQKRELNEYHSNALIIELPDTPPQKPLVSVDIDLVSAPPAETKASIINTLAVRLKETYNTAIAVSRENNMKPDEIAAQKVLLSTIEDIQKDSLYSPAIKDMVLSQISRSFLTNK